MDKLCLSYPVVVEGKYDKIKIESLFESVVITTEGFSIFKNAEKKQLIRMLAAKSPIIVLTDSDSAGRMIRGHLSSMIPPDRIINAYIPQVGGKEKRKPKPSAQGFLGVEGIDETVLREILLPFTAEDCKQGMIRHEITTSRLYELGLTGQENSAHLRDVILQQMGLPSKMTAKSFKKAVELLISEEDLAKMMER